MLSMIPWFLINFYCPSQRLVYEILTEKKSEKYKVVVPQFQADPKEFPQYFGSLIETGYELGQCSANTPVTQMDHSGAGKKPTAPMLKKRRANVGNLGRLAENEEPELSSSELSLMEQSKKAFDWETGNPEDECAQMNVGDITETESILSEMLEDEDVPTTDAKSLDAFLRKAMLSMEEIVE